MEQVCTIGISGLLGMICIALYYNKGQTGVVRVDLLLRDSLCWTVLAGGITLVLLAAVRAVALLVAMRRTASAREHGHAHDHDHCHDHDHDHAHDHHHHHHHEHGTCDHHDHDHDHDHEHAHDHDHDHEHAHAPAVAGSAGHDHGDDDHGHDHGYAPWRYVLLLLPVVLFFLNLPNQGFLNVGQASSDGLDTGKAAAVVDNNEDEGELNFLELEGAVYAPDRRAQYQGKTYTIKGQFRPSGKDRVFSLVRFKKNCCAADAVPLGAFIMIDPDSPERLNQAALAGQWVAVKGQVQFRTQARNGKEEPVAVIYVRPDKEHPLLDKEDEPVRVRGLVRVLAPNEQPSPFVNN
jgi:hypothetical protein